MTEDFYKFQSPDEKKCCITITTRDAREIQKNMMRLLTVRKKLISEIDVQLNVTCGKKIRPTIRLKNIVKLRISFY